MADWPPTLDALKTDLGKNIEDATNDAPLQQELDAAVAFVPRVRPDVDYDESDPDLAGPTDDLLLGTLRLAGRWYTRRRSPDLLVAGGELGTTKVPNIDADIERLLRIGRHQIPKVA